MTCCALRPQNFFASLSNSFSPLSNYFHVQLISTSKYFHVQVFAAAHSVGHPQIAVNLTKA